LKNPVKFEKIFKYFFILIFATFLGSLPFIYLFKLSFLEKVAIEALLLVFSAFSYIVWKNLKRFNQAQIKGVFKVEEIF